MSRFSNFSSTASGGLKPASSQLLSFGSFINASDIYSLGNFIHHHYSSSPAFTHFASNFSDEEVMQQLGETDWMNFTNWHVWQLAKELNATTKEQVLKNIFYHCQYANNYWDPEYTIVSNNQMAAIDDNQRKASDMQIRKQGSRHDMHCLAGALIRAFNIPVRMVYGCAGEPFMYTVYLQVYFEGKWRPFCLDYPEGFDYMIHETKDYYVYSVMHVLDTNFPYFLHMEYGANDVGYQYNNPYQDYNPPAYEPPQFTWPSWWPF